LPQLILELREKLKKMWEEELALNARFKKRPKKGEKPRDPVMALPDGKLFRWGGEAQGDKQKTGANWFTRHSEFEQLGGSQTGRAKLAKIRKYHLERGLGLYVPPQVPSDPSFGALEKIANINLDDPKVR
jgi:hypothetical protein